MGRKLRHWYTKLACKVCWLEALEGLPCYRPSLIDRPEKPFPNLTYFSVSMILTPLHRLINIKEYIVTQTLIAPEKQLNVRPPLLARHPLVSYFTLAYAISWLLWLPLVLSKGGGIGLIPFTTDSTLHGAITVSLIILGAFGPAIAAVIMTAVTEGRAGVGLLFRRIVRVRVGWQ